MRDLLGEKLKRRLQGSDGFRLVVRRKKLFLSIETSLGKFSRDSFNVLLLVKTLFIEGWSSVRLTLD